MLLAEILVRKNSMEKEPGARVRDVSERLLRYDESLCTENFLGELQAMLPNPTVVGKLNQYRTADESVLATLHVADRFMVELIKIDHIKDRIDGMLYRTSFSETLEWLSTNAKTVFQAAQAVQEATHFGELLRLMLILGNYMNGSGYNGGAFGFKISSINRVSHVVGVCDYALAQADEHPLFFFSARRHKV